MQTSYVQIILETKIYSLFVLYIFEKMMWHIVFHSKAHTHVGLFWKKKAVVSNSKRKQYNS